MILEIKFGSLRDLWISSKFIQDKFVPFATTIIRRLMALEIENWFYKMSLAVDQPNLIRPISIFEGEPELIRPIEFPALRFRTIVREECTGIVNFPSAISTFYIQIFSQIFRGSFTRFVAVVYRAFRPAFSR